mgnify:FL=1
MKNGIVISALLFIAGIVVMLLQLWFNLWSAEMLFKMLATLAALFVISLVVAFVRKEMRDTRRLRNGDD